jgi:large subunit ribosomal protein L15
MPLYRRLPKRGFKNPFRRAFAVVNLDDLGRCFPRGGDVTPATMAEAGLLGSTPRGLVKILGQGDLPAGASFSVQAHAFSKAAAGKIQAAGGRTEVIPA